MIPYCEQLPMDENVAVHLSQEYSQLAPGPVLHGYSRTQLTRLPVPGTSSDRLMDQLNLCLVILICLYVPDTDSGHLKAEYRCMSLIFI